MIAADLPPPVLIAVGVMALVAVVLLLFGFRSLKRKRLIENVPTSKVKGVFLGLNEIKGEALSGEPLTGYLSGASCVYYRYSVDEEWEREETYTDNEGETKTRTTSGWSTVDKDTSDPPFELRDDTGALRVDPRGAEVQAVRTFSETCRRSDPLYYAKGPGHAISDSTHRRRFVEHAIPLGHRIYVIGPARLRDDVVEPEIAHRKGSEIYLISTRREEKISSGYGIAAFFTLLFGTVLAFAAPVVLLSPGTRDAGSALQTALPLALTVAAVYGGVIFVYYLTLLYNGLVSVRERAEMARSMIDVQLKRRHDLIPRLAACVKGYASHEQETQDRLASLRGGGDDTGALRQLFALAEAYPDLKADTNFAQLQRELVDSEDRIALAREFYNATVTALRNRLQTLPDSLLAKLGEFRKLDYFAAGGFERAPVLIDWQRG